MPPRRSLFYRENNRDYHSECADGYVRGEDDQRDYQLEKWNRCRCVFCDKPNRTGRCHICPIRKMKQIVLYVAPYLPRPSN